ncbi:MAG: magnesium transporter CorA family protein [Bacteroidales bacterium]|jgi:magnesium transporter|nr:magnesium transporter CorA family protein [Bacteroidota bacterium]MCF8347341.1 magnesium transporter CorA family protein [Bacteroidales bacterium]
MRETIKIGRLRWVHIKSPSEEDFEFLSSRFHFHQLDIEDCRQKNQRPKIDIYDDYYFLILHFPVFDRQNQFIKPSEVKIFWGEDYIITVGKTHWMVDRLFENALKQEKAGIDFEVGTSDALLYTILEQLMTESVVLLRRVGLELEMIGRELFVNKPTRVIQRLSVTRKNIIALNTMYKPQLRVFNKFESGSVEGFAHNMEDYWGNILDYYNNMWDMTEDYGELIDGLSTTFDSMQTNKTNEIMKILTLISSIILPLTFLTGLYGMNVLLPLQEDNHAFWIITVIMLLVGGGMITYFRRKKWM